MPRTKALNSKSNIRQNTQNDVAAALQFQIDSLSAVPLKNYIQYFNGNDTTGWATYADAAGTSPVDGTGGTANVTWGTTTSSPLRGDSSFLFTKDAANRQGQGVSYDFTIDSVDQAKAMTIAFDYAVGSGTFADADMSVWIYDKTNAVVIQPSAYTILNVGGSGTRKVAEFQTASNSTSYRLILHVGSTSALAYTLKLDNVTVGPNTYNLGAAVTPWVAYTPTFTGFGTVSNASAFYRRVGDSLQVQGSFTSGTPAASLASISLPSVSLDSTKLSISNTTANAGPMVGQWQGSGSGQYAGLVTATGTSTSLIYFAAEGVVNQLTPKNGDTVIGTSQVCDFYFTVPIAGWGTSQVLSSDTDTRVVAAKYFVTASHTVTSSAPAQFNTKSIDTHGAVTTGASWRFTAPVAGLYDVSPTLITPTGAAAFAVYKNGVLNTYVVATTAASDLIPGRTIVDLVAGDYIEIRSNVSATISDTNASISITRLSGPAQIAASEKIKVSYRASGNTSVTTIQPARFDEKITDSHGAVTTGASWKFTAPRADRFLLNVYLNNSAAVGSNSNVKIYKNGVALKSFAFVTASLGWASGATQIDLLAGDYIDVRTENTYPAYGASDTISSYIDICSQG